MHCLFAIGQNLDKCTHHQQCRLMIDKQQKARRFWKQTIDYSGGGQSWEKDWRLNLLMGKGCISNWIVRKSFLGWFWDSGWFGGSWVQEALSVNRGGAEGELGRNSVDLVTNLALWCFNSWVSLNGQRCFEMLFVCVEFLLWFWKKGEDWRGNRTIL